MRQLLRLGNGLFRFNTEITVAVLELVNFRFWAEHWRKSGDFRHRRNNKTVNIGASDMLRIVFRITVGYFELNKSRFALYFLRKESIVCKPAVEFAVERHADGASAEEADVARDVRGNGNAECQIEKGDDHGSHPHGGKCDPFFEKHQ